MGPQAISPPGAAAAPFRPANASLLFPWTRRRCCPNANLDKAQKLSRTAAAAAIERVRNRMSEPPKCSELELDSTIITGSLGFWRGPKDCQVKSTEDLPGLP